MADEPCPASFEKSALCIPNIKAAPAVPPRKALLDSIGENAALTMSLSISGIAVKLIARTYMQAMT